MKFSNSHLITVLKNEQAWLGKSDIARIGPTKHWRLSECWSMLTAVLASPRCKHQSQWCYKHHICMSDLSWNEMLDHWAAYQESESLTTWALIDIRRNAFHMLYRPTKFIVCSSWGIGQKLVFFFFGNGKKLLACGNLFTALLSNTTLSRDESVHVMCFWLYPGTSPYLAYFYFCDRTGFLNFPGVVFDSMKQFWNLALRCSWNFRLQKTGNWDEV